MARPVDLDLNDERGDYNWDELLDGRTWLIPADEVKMKDFRPYAHTVAKRKGTKVRIRKNQGPEGGFYVQAFTN